MKISVCIQTMEYEEIDVEFPLYTRLVIAEDYIIYNRLDEDGTLISIRKDNVSIMISRTIRDMSEALDASLIPDHESGERVCSEAQFTDMLDEILGQARTAYQDIARSRPSM